jgi:hypothetical protein
MLAGVAGTEWQPKGVWQWQWLEKNVAIEWLEGNIG